MFFLFNVYVHLCSSKLGLCSLFICFTKTWLSIGYIYLLISSDIYIYPSIYLFIWVVVWNMFFFSIYWECHHPNCRTHIFQRGRSTTNQLSIDYIYWFLLIYLYKSIYIYTYPSIYLFILVGGFNHFFPFHVWDNPSHWLLYFAEG